MMNKGVGFKIQQASSSQSAIRQHLGFLNYSHTIISESICTCVSVCHLSYRCIGYDIWIHWSIIMQSAKFWKLSFEIINANWLSVCLRGKIHIEMLHFFFCNILVKVIRWWSIEIQVGCTRSQSTLHSLVTEDHALRSKNNKLIFL